MTLLWLMQLCVRGIRPDIRAAVEDLRLHRMWMVQNLVSTSTFPATESVDFHKGINNKFTLFPLRLKGLILRKIHFTNVL